MRSVFTRAPLNHEASQNTKITAIVPFDRQLIVSALSPSRDNGAAQAKISVVSLKEREIFSKTFDEIFSVALPVISKSKAFFEAKMREAMPEHKDTEDHFRFYLIFGKMVEASSSGAATPRQVISFINELLGCIQYTGGKFRLPTIAAYLSCRDTLEVNPSSLTEADSLNPRIKTLANDPEIEKNLAAMVFNVEPEHAYEILLDPDIKRSVVSDESRLIEFARSPGFDLRVGDVLETSVSEWIKAGEFCIAPLNITKLIKDDITGASAEMAAIIRRGFLQVDDLPGEVNEYTNYLSVLDCCDASTAAPIFNHFISLMSPQMASEEDEIEAGEEFVNFIADLREASEKRELGEIFNEVLGKQKIKTTPGIAFGMAGSIETKGIPLRGLGSIGVN